MSSKIQNALYLQNFELMRYDKDMHSFLPKIKDNATIIIFLIIAVIATTTIVYITDRTLKDLLVSRARTIAALLDKQAIQSLSGNDSDLSNSSYQTVKSQLADVYSANEQFRFVYLMKQSGNNVIFLVDSEPSDSEDYSPPGQIYYEASPLLKSVLTEGISGWEVSGDRWGLWMSSLAPITDANGRVIALVGIDLDYYTSYLLPIVGFAMIPVLAFLLVFFIIVYSKRIQKIEKNVITEKEQLMHIASHEIQTPVAKTGWAAEELLESTALDHDPKAKALVKGMYIDLITLVTRTSNLLKAIDMTAPVKIDVNLVDLIPLVHEAVDDHRKAAGIRHVTFDYISELPVHAMTKGRHDYIHVVFENLISHALYYTREHSSVKIAYKDAGDFHEFSAISTGDSLKDEEIIHLFSAYYKGEPLSGRTESTGLGLYLSQKIMKLLHGSITAISSVTGVTLTASFPKYKA